ncbi:tetratricopeptide repeat protein [Nocardiopsis potens]|uniref:tetratricopeptide repeat protein n=1 Tax=Nocardiopsis potens TaxID=1246458 RepID=UPI0003480046|nr:tetratricopeptide repeat protein [Nocardiopsis potens]
MVVGRLPERSDHFQHRAVSDRLTRAAAESPAVVLSGMGGVGKTQLAADHAHRALEHGAADAVVWIEAGSRTSVVSAYAQAARAVGAAPPNAAAGPEDQAQVFLSWLRTTHKRWLVVLDDAAPPSGDEDAPLGLEYLDGLWPPETTVPSEHSQGRKKGVKPRWGGRTLVTTRRKDAALASGNRTVLDVEVFTPEEAVTFLTHALTEHGIQAPEAEAAGLAGELGHLPLALAQAAAYIADERLDCAAYRRLLTGRKRRLDQLTPDVGSLPTGHARTVAATLALSIDHADRLPPAGWARPLMQVLGLLSPDAVPVSVLTTRSLAAHLLNAAGDEGREHGEKGEKAVQKTALWSLGVLRRFSLITATESFAAEKSVQKAALRSLGVLRRLGLITAAGPLTAEGATVAVHALTQRAARETLTGRRRDRAVRAAADALEEAWPEIERDTALGRALRACTTALDDHAADALWASKRRRVLFQAGNSLGAAGQVAAAVDHWKRMLREAEHRLGPDHIDTLTARNNLAAWTGDAGDPAEAARMLTELLPVLQRVLGPDHPGTLAARNNLATWTGEAGDPAEAARLFAELLPARTRILGPDHPDTLTTRNNLATCTGDAGDPDEAVRLLAGLLTDRTRALGPDHPDTLTTRNNLATWTGDAGNPAEAARMLAELLPDRTRILGPDHPHTLTTRNNLAAYTGYAGDPDEAARMLAELLGHQERVLGPGHPHILVTRKNLRHWREQAAGEGGGRE